jgi:hypothetical protein
MFCPGCGEESRYGTMFCEYCDTAVSPSVVATRVLGPFTGWSGETVVALATGDHWKQASAGATGCQLESPRAWLYPTGSGHALRVEGLSGDVEVTRHVPDPAPAA